MYNNYTHLRWGGEDIKIKQRRFKVAHDCNSACGSSRKSASCDATTR